MQKNGEGTEQRGGPVVGILGRLMGSALLLIFLAAGVAVLLLPAVHSREFDRARAQGMKDLPPAPMPHLRQGLDNRPLITTLEPRSGGRSSVALPGQVRPRARQENTEEGR